MFKNYFKTAFRNLKHNKAFTAINMAGLVAGLAVFALIMLWVKNETGYDDFHKDSDRIAAVMVNRINNGDVATFPACPTMLAPAMQKDIAAIEYASRCSWGDVKLFTYNEKNFSEEGLYVDPSFLTIFSFPLIKGNINNNGVRINTANLKLSLDSQYRNPISNLSFPTRIKLYALST